MPADTFFRRVRASSLMITVILALVIGVVCSMLILLAYFNMNLRVDLRIEEKLGRDLNNAINLALKDNIAEGSFQRRGIDLFGQGHDSAYIQEELWGVFQAATVEVRDGNRFRSKSFFSGSILPAHFDGCLYLADHQRSLSIVGSTQLTGKAYLPKGGVKPGYVDQRGYDHLTLVDGPTETSTDSLPALNEAVIRYYGQLPGKDTGRKTGDVVPDSLRLSFRDSARTLIARGMVTLSGVCLQGHILIVSDSVVDVGADAQLENVIICAPVIRFHSGFSGRVQAFGSDSLVTEDNCRFSFPSALVLVKKKEDSRQPKLVIGGNNRLEGLVLSWCPANDKNLTYSEIKAGSTIQGVVYVKGYLLLKANVSGTVLTDYFIYRSPAVVYEDFLVDVRLDRSGLGRWYAGSMIFNGKKNNRVLQWVN